MTQGSRRTRAQSSRGDRDVHESRPGPGDQLFQEAPLNTAARQRVRSTYPAVLTDQGMFPTRAYAKSTRSGPGLMTRCHREPDPGGADLHR